MKNNVLDDLISKWAAIDILEVAINNDWEFDYAKNMMIELSTQPGIIRCKDCRYSEYDFIFHSRYCHNKEKADLVGDDFFCAAGRYQTNGSD